MRYTGYIVLAWCLVVFAGCTSKTTDDTFTIDIDLLASQDPLFKFEINRYIPLETKDDVLLGFIRNIEYRNGMYFISDWDSNIIHIFDNDGKHLFSLSKQGRGPGEYISASHFTLDEEMNIYVFCGKTTHIYKYAYPDYKFESSIEIIDGNLIEICWHEDIMWGANYLSNMKAEGLVQLNNGVVDIIIPFRKEFDDPTERLLVKPQSFYYSETLLFNQRMSPDVYRLSGEKAEKIFKIKSKHMVRSADFDPHTDINILGFNSLFQGENFIAGTLWTNNIHTYDIFVYEPLTHRASLIDARNLPRDSGSISAVSGDYFVTIVSPARLIHEDYGKDRLLDELMSKITHDCNPVIVEFSIREI
ncbi:MAG: 6-bladed beta-propeller [Rikenellaceae bacterium]|nr:6-bladed beta-propeller [Rikenellaceae bacterium]MCL2691915.1 6-bladed beta-propeller [Rikenellaceae bacterium]